MTRVAVGEGGPGVRPPLFPEGPGAPAGVYQEEGFRGRPQAGRGRGGVFTFYQVREGREKKHRLRKTGGRREKYRFFIVFKLEAYYWKYLLSKT